MKSIVVEHLTKTYKSTVKEKKEASFRELLLDQATSFFKPALDITTFDALHDISFEVEQGEVLGIIGKNGSGKSTLLKILSKITTPTSGRAVIKGRVASLLEVGTGFHGELSGRENIYLSGIILGMKRWEINQHFDEIVSFADIAHFLDTPVKHYSSGMQLRLAFSIAAHLRSDVLLMDEVLAVGDHEFEKKCLESVSNLSKSGRTILFVSHNLLSIRRLCSKVLVLQKGKQLFMGDPISAIVSYLELKRASEYGYVWGKEGLLLNGLLLLYSIQVVNIKGMKQKEFFLNESVGIEIIFNRLNHHNNLLINLFFYDDSETLLFSASEFLSGGDISSVAGMCSLTCIVPPYIFQEGKIVVGMHILNLGQEGKAAQEGQCLIFAEKGILYFITRDSEKTILGTGDFWLEEKGKVKPRTAWKMVHNQIMR